MKLQDYLKTLKVPKKPRKNWKKELRMERNRVLDEAISHLKKESRCVPASWVRGYMSAITKLEMMKD